MNKNKLKKILKIILLFFLIMIFIYSIYQIFSYIVDSSNSKKLIKDIIENTEIIDYKSENAENIGSEDKPNTPYWNFIKMNLIDVNFEELKTINSDTVAWLYVGGTNVNYPVVQTTDNDFYLNHSFDKTKNNGGWIFMDYRNNKNEYEKNTIIYGHNMKDQTMFGTLKKLLTKSWYQNEDNRIIKMSSENYNTLWQIYSVYTLDNNNDYIQTYFSDDVAYQNFLDLVQKRSITNFNTLVSPTDKTLTLSTCHGSTKKLVVHAKLIKIEAK